jgi:hypothetical protein
VRQRRAGEQQESGDLSVRVVSHRTARRQRARLELLRAASFPAVAFLTLYLCGFAVGQARSAGIAGAPAAMMFLCAACLVLMLAALLMACARPPVL